MPEDQIPPNLLAYFQARSEARSEGVARAWSAMTDDERTLVREASVMGYVQGTRAGADPDIPADHVITEIVLAAAAQLNDLYPRIAAMTEHRSPRRDHEHFAAQIVDIHQPRSGEPASCSTCVDADTGTPAAWPCATVQVLGKIARCENDIELDDENGNVRRCDGYLVFRPGAPQARCLTCHAWCGYLVATYVDVPTPAA